MNLEEFNKKPWSSYQTYGRPGETVTIPETIKSLYIINLNTLKPIELELIPDTLAESYQQRMISLSTYGLVSPMHFYTGGEGKILNFSFQMIEDLQNTDGSIYKLLKEIQSLSEAVELTDKQQIQPPTVYMQLGNQFAGKGFINSSISLEGPYRNERYTLVNVDMTFTYIEEYNTVYNLEDKYSDYDPADIYRRYLGDIDGFDSPDSIEDFIKKSMDYDYLTKQIYSNIKLQNYLSIVNVEIKDKKKRKTGNTYSLAVNKKDLGYNLTKYFEDFGLIIGTPGLTISAYINNLNTLKTRIMNEYHNIRTIKDLSEDAVYSAREALNELLTLINNQIKIYSMSKGAGG